MDIKNENNAYSNNWDNIDRFYLIEGTFYVSVKDENVNELKSNNQERYICILILEIIKNNNFD